MQQPVRHAVATAAATLCLALLAACGGGSSDDTTTTTPTSNASVPPGIYVTNINNTIVSFALAANGNAAPQRSIAGSATGLSLPIGIGADKQGNLYVANRTGSSVTVYPGTSTGNVAPTRTLAATGMGSPGGLAIGPTDEVYVSTCPGCGQSAGGATGVFHFANSSSVSDFSLAGANTGMTVPGSIALDSNRNLYVANSFGGNIGVFAPGASGNSLPIRSFTLAAGGNLQSISVGANSGNNAIALSIPGRGIDLFTLSASGGALTAAATLAPSPTLPLAYPGGIYFDNSVTPPVVYINDFSANAVYVVQTAGTAPNLTVGSVRIISGAATGLSSPLGITVVH